MGHRWTQMNTDRKTLYNKAGRNGVGLSGKVAEIAMDTPGRIAWNRLEAACERKTYADGKLWNAEKG